jgi:hypothetical protein
VYQQCDVSRWPDLLNLFDVCEKKWNDVPDAYGMSPPAPILILTSVLHNVSNFIWTRFKLVLVELLTRKSKVYVPASSSHPSPTSGKTPSKTKATRKSTLTSHTQLNSPGSP